MGGEYKLIETKKELDFYIKADRIMNTGSVKIPFIHNLFYPNYRLRFLKLLRKCEYYSRHNPLLFNYYYLAFWRLSHKLGFSIDLNVFGYGLIIPHYGTIVVGGGNKIGNYCVLHTSTCITAGRKKIGDGFYVSTGAKVIKDIECGDGVSVAANSVLLNSVEENDVLVGGTPARIIKKSEKWWIRDGDKYSQRVKMVEDLKKEMQI